MLHWVRDSKVWVDKLMVDKFNSRVAGSPLLLRTSFMSTPPSLVLLGLGRVAGARRHGRGQVPLHALDTAVVTIVTNVTIITILIIFTTFTITIVITFNINIT